MPTRTCSRGHTFQGEEPCPECWPGYRTFTVRARVWLYQGHAGWHFLTLPKAKAKCIQERFGGNGPSWGMVPVTATIGSTVWQSSIFYDTKAASYLLPLKAAVRKAEGIQAGRTVTCTLTVRT